MKEEEEQKEEEEEKDSQMNTEKKSNNDEKDATSEVKKDGTKSQMNESMSMMCPICHFFMNKSVCASCSHMFCQYCLDEYLIFKESCPVWEKSIRKGKITRCWVADSAIKQMLMFSNEEHIKEFERKKKVEAEYYANKKIDESIIQMFNK